MTINRKKTAIALAISSAIFLSACNDDDNHNTGSNPPDPTTSAPLTLTAMDGYIKNAFICADVNENNACEASEIIRDLNGNYVVTNTAGKVDTHISLEADALLKKHTLMIATVRTFDSNSDIFSEDMDLPGNSMNPISLRAPAGSKLISPITDLVVAKMNVGVDEGEVQTREPKMTKEQAQKEVVAALAEIDSEKLLTEEMLYGDYLIDKSNPEANRQMLAKRSHKVAQILAESKSNARSDALFDKYSDNVIALATDAVKDMNNDEVADLTYKPYVPVGISGAGAEVIENKKVRFNQANMLKLQSKLADLTGLSGVVGQWDESIIYIDDLNDSVTDAVGIEALISDLDDQDHSKFHDIFISNKENLELLNLRAEFIHKKDSDAINRDHIKISRINKDEAVSGGTYSILISTNDLNFKGDEISVTDENEISHPVMTTSITKLIFTVDNDNVKPIINHEKLLQLQKEIKNWGLKEGEIINSTSIDLDGLFIDTNGDQSFEYTTDLNIPGVTLIKNSDTHYTLSGMPYFPIKNKRVTIIAKDIGGLETVANFHVTVKVNSGNNNLVDEVTKANSIWYQWITKTDEGVSKAYCQGIKLNKENNYIGNYLSIANPGSCPSEMEFNAKKITGYWKADKSTIVLTSDSGTERSFSGLENDTESELASITTFEKLMQPKVRVLDDSNLQIDEETEINGVTLYKGYEVAQKSWESATAVSYIKDNPVIAVNGFKRSASDLTQTYADVPVSFIDTKCDSLGLAPKQENKLNTNNDFSNMVWSDITAILNDKLVTVTKVTALDLKKGEINYCRVDLRVSNADQSIKLGDNLAMHFIAKDDTSNSDMVISGFADRRIDIQPKYNLNEILNSEDSINGINILSNEEGSTPIYHLIHLNGKKPSLTVFSDKTDNSPIEGIEYKTYNSENTIYQFDRLINEERELITIWSDDDLKVKITLNHDQPEVEYDIKSKESE